MVTKYTYEKEAVLGRLELEIRASAAITHALDYMTSLGTTVDIYFKEELSAGEITALDAIVTSHVPTPLDIEPQEVTISGTTSMAGNLIIEQGIFAGPVGSRGLSICTPDFGDRTTWYQKSVQVTNEVLTDTGNGLTFSSANPHWININSLRLTCTHKQLPKRDGTYGKHSDWATTVKVDSVSVTEGFAINFAAGTITFEASQAGKTVTVTYWHNNNVSHPSEWLLTPPAGKKYLVQHMEMQASAGVGLADTLRFEIWAGSSIATYGAFPDYLFEAGYGQMRADYRSANDFINAANLGQGVVAKFGGLTSEVIVLPFNYMQAFYLDSAVGATFRIVLLNDIPYSDSEIATGTFYAQLS